MKWWAVLWLCVGLGLGLGQGAGEAAPYVLEGYRYASPHISFHTDSLISGYNGPSVAAAMSWNAATGLDLHYSDRDWQIELGGGYFGDTGWNASTVARGVSGGRVSGHTILLNYSLMDQMDLAERQSVIAHEIGHCLGLDHVKMPDNLMCTSRDGRFAVVPGPGDLAGVQMLYGGSFRARQ